MAFNNLGDCWIAPGGQLTLAIWFGFGSMSDGGDDAGAQWIMADPITRGFLLVKDQIKSNYGQSAAGDRNITYAATVVNLGPEVVNFSLQGGGNT